MEWKATIATLALLGALTPIATAEDEEELIAWRCEPVADGSSTVVKIATATYYQKLYAHGGYYIEELWQEVNAEPGLQSSPGMSCVGKSDRLVGSACVGFCPLKL